MNLFRNHLIAFWITFITRGVTCLNTIRNHRGFIPINPESLSNRYQINQDNTGWKPMISYAQRSGRYHVPQIFQDNQAAITVPFVIEPKSGESNAVHNVKDFQGDRRAVNVQKLEVIDSYNSYKNSSETESPPRFDKSQNSPYKLNNNIDHSSAVTTVQEMTNENIKVGNSWESLLKEIDTKLAVLIKENYSRNALAPVAGESNDTNTPQEKSHAIGRRISPHTEAGYDVPLILNSQLVVGNKSATPGDYRDSASEGRHAGNSLASDIDIPTPLSSVLLSTFQTVDISNDVADNGNKSVARSYKREGDLREVIASPFMSLSSLGFDSTTIKANDYNIADTTVQIEDIMENNVNAVESVIHIQNQSYELGNNSQKHSLRPHYLSKDITLTNYPRAFNSNHKNLVDIFNIFLKKYNIMNTDSLSNYDISRIPDSAGYIDGTKFTDYKKQRYNSLNHFPPDPLTAVWLSHYGHYDPGQHGRASSYRNLYSYLASNNIHNNKPFAAYKIFEDTDV